jgi:hypothetical protein
MRERCEALRVTATRKAGEIPDFLCPTLLKKHGVFGVATRGVSHALPD